LSWEHTGVTKGTNKTHLERLINIKKTTQHGTRQEIPQKSSHKTWTQAEIVTDLLRITFPDQV